jgi:hypothetical protein
MNLTTSNDKISKASNVRKVAPLYNLISDELSKIDILQHVRIYNGRIQASNVLSTNGKKEPIEVYGQKVAILKSLDTWGSFGNIYKFITDNSPKTIY